MKNTSHAAGILVLSLVLCGGASSGMTGCAASSTTGDFGSGDDGGVSHADGGTTHHDGGGGGIDAGGGGQDSGGGGQDSGGGGQDSGGGGDSGGMGCGVMTANPTCTACIDSMCCNEGTACGANSECIPLSMCYGACPQPTTQACADACDAQHPNGVAVLNALGTCLQTNCPTMCP